LKPSAESVDWVKLGETCVPVNQIHTNQVRQDVVETHRQTRIVLYVLPAVDI